MAGEKREVILDLLARDKSGPATKAFGKNLDDVATSADKAGKKTKDLGDATEATGRKTGAFGGQADGAAAGIAKLDAQISSATKQLEGLALQFANASDKATKLDLSKNIRTLENDIRRSTKSKGILESILPTPSAADISGWSSKISTSVSSAMAGISPAALGGGILAAALAPTLGAALSGAVVGGAGLGGIIGGIALAAKDPGIVGHATQIGNKFTDSLNKSAKSAFLVPLQESMVKIEGLAARTAPKIGAVFAATAPSVGKLTDHLVAAGDALVNGFTAAASRSAPVIESIGALIENAGVQIGNFMEMASTHSEAGASAIGDMDNALQNLIKTTTAVVDFLGESKEALDGFDAGIDKGRYALEDLIPTLDFTADGYDEGTTAAKLYREGVIGAAGSINDYAHYATGATEKTKEQAEAHTNAARAAEGQRTAMDELSKELRGQADPVFALMTASDKLAAAQTKSAEAIKKHGSDSRESRAATRELALASIDLQGKVGALGDTFTGELTPEMITNLRTSRLTEAQIRDVATQFRAAKRDGESYAKNFKANAQLTGGKGVISELQRIKRFQDNIDRSVNIAVNVVTSSAHAGYAAAQAEIAGRRATGGPVSKDLPYWVGENGPELVIPDTNARVLSAAASRATTSKMSSAGGGGIAPGRLQIELAGQAEIVTMFRYLMRSANLLQGA